MQKRGAHPKVAANPAATTRARKIDSAQGDAIDLDRVVGAYAQRLTAAGADLAQGANFD
ncbi:MAG: hypothetical protein RL385_4632, partial [Pseudomonadota bacterium]